MQKADDPVRIGNYVYIYSGDDDSKINVFKFEIDGF